MTHFTIGEHKEEREDGSVTLLSREVSDFLQSEIRSNVSHLDKSDIDQSPHPVATAKGSARNSNPLNHMRQRMRTIERNSHKLPALVGSA